MRGTDAKLIGGSAEEVRTYRLFTLGERLFVVSLCSFVGGLFLLVDIGWSLGLLTVNDNARPVTEQDWLLVLSGFAVAALCLSFVAGCLTQPHSVSLHSDGQIQFRSVIGRINTYASKIREIKKFAESVTLESDDARRVRLEYVGDSLDYVGGSLVLSNVSELGDFLEELTRLNPNIRVTGHWPE